MRASGISEMYFFSVATQYLSKNQKNDAIQKRTLIYFEYVHYSPNGWSSND